MKVENHISIHSNLNLNGFSNSGGLDRQHRATNLGKEVNDERLSTASVNSLTRHRQQQLILVALLTPNSFSQPIFPPQFHPIKHTCSASAQPCVGVASSPTGAFCGRSIRVATNHLYNQQEEGQQTTPAGHVFRSPSLVRPTWSFFVDFIPRAEARGIIMFCSCWSTLTSSPWFARRSKEP